MKVKICGVTNVDDARMVAEAGADMIGINLWPYSKRHVSAPETVRPPFSSRPNPPEVRTGYSGGRRSPGSKAKDWL